MRLQVCALLSLVPVLVGQPRPLDGVNFGPYLPGQSPNIGSQVTRQQIIDRLTILQPYFTWIRSYGLTNGLEQIPSIARSLGFKVAAEAYIDSNTANNTAGINNLIAAANGGLVDIAIVGSEAPVSDSVLIGYMNQVRQAIPAAIPVTTAETIPALTPNLIAASDIVMVDIYPYYSGVPIANATCSLISAYRSVVSQANGKRVILGETGWPSAAGTIRTTSPADEAQYFAEVSSFVKANNIQSFFFEAFDEAWKATPQLPEEAFFGIWDQNGVLKPGMQSTLSGNNTAFVSCGGTPDNPPTVFIDVPATGSILTAPVTLAGWAIDNAYLTGTAIAAVQVKLDGNVLGNATYGSPRPDVCNVFPGRPNCPNVGFTFSLNPATMSAGSHTLTVTAFDTDTLPDSAAATVTFQVPGPPAVVIDGPAPGPVSGTVAVFGWAVDNASLVGTAIASVQVKVDGVFVGTAAYGVPRPDVCNVLSGRAGCPNVGYLYQLNTAALSPGPHSIAVVALDSDGTQDSAQATVSVTVTATGPIPYLTIDAPVAGSLVSGTVPVGGWALDNPTGSGTAIGSVQVKVDGTFAGNATYGVPRPDVCTAFPGRAGCPNVGFTYQWDTSRLTPGPHTITVGATDTDGTPDSGSASATVVVISPPVVFIDSPTPGAISGSVTVSGWVIDNIAYVGTPISSVVVKVDGVPVGTANYGVRRADVCAVFPGRPNCPNVGYNFILDTTRFSHGSHVITVMATDSDGTPDGASASVSVTW